ncbi:hypothetical protein AURDEDRAFT_181194 [Auricularia subglabra TFB-10046 SS5]|nr:hypothetical protein AURDEDRAFT_181194 [Auricularia subglabra TFB-10046 SS5]
MPISSATLLVSTCVECLLYGIAVAVFALSAYLLVFHLRTADSLFPMLLMLASLSALLLICSIHLALALAGAARALGHPTPVTSHHRAGMLALYTTANAVADGCLTWRVWLAWGRQARAAAAPIILLAATTACGYSAAKFASHPWTTGFVASALVTHTVVTGLIALRVYTLHGPLTKESHALAKEMRPQLVLLALNGACYAVPLAVLLILHLCRSAAATVLCDSMVHITLLVPALSVIRITIARGKTASTISTTPWTDFPRRRPDTPASFLQAPPSSPQAPSLPITFPLTPAATHSPTTTLARLSLPTLPPPAHQDKEGQSCLGVCICCASPQSAVGSIPLLFLQ